MAEPTIEGMKSMNDYTEKRLTKLFKRADKGKDEAQEELDELSYGERPEILVTFTLAGGGPSQWIKAKFDRDGDLTDVTMIATWGGSTNDERRYSPGDAVWRYAEQYGEYVVNDLREAGR